MTEEDKLLYCSFCGKSQLEVLKLIAGPKDIFICEKCTDKCVGIIFEEHGENTIEVNTPGEFGMPNLESLILKAQSKEK